MKAYYRKRLANRFFSPGVISGLLVLLIFTSELEKKMSYSLLCLGDSYTIGEGVLTKENFPNQTVQLLLLSGYDFKKPTIIAQTGWTTDELKAAIDENRSIGTYDFVTLLIGVNNQYRGKPVEDYQSEFESLLKESIEFANGKSDHVIVLSIPDWGVTPFAKDRDTHRIAKEIDAYNKVNKEIAAHYHTTYIDITAGTREALNDLTLLASDSLHPSGKAYAKWSEEIYSVLKRQLQ
jgi:lysophospholipase L1-like esterase